MIGVCNAEALPESKFDRRVLPIGTTSRHVLGDKPRPAPDCRQFWASAIGERPGRRPAFYLDKGRGRGVAGIGFSGNAELRFDQHGGEGAALGFL
jgi:hypothetical protein